MRANGHGSSLSAKINWCQGTNCGTSAGTYTTILANGAMSPTISTPQSATVSLAGIPEGVTVLQFIGNLTGSLWYDCAYVQIGAATTGGGGGGTGGGTTDPCLNATRGGCSTNANCQSTAGAVTCTCKGGYYGNGKTCTAFSPSNYLSFTLKVNVNTTGLAPFQNDVTDQIARMLGIPSGRVLYDRADIITGSNPVQSIAYVSISPDPLTGAKPTELGDLLATKIAQGDGTISYPVASATIGSTVVVYGSNPPSSDDNTTTIAVATVIPICAVIALVVGFFIYKKRKSASSSPSSFSHVVTPAGNPWQSTPVTPAAAPPPATTASAWTAERDTAGHIYYFNHQTGQSQWHKPEGVYVPPPM